jgi:hypothetical protein
MVGEHAGNFCAIAAANSATISPASLLFTSAVQSVPHLPQVLSGGVDANVALRPLEG